MEKTENVKVGAEYDFVEEPPQEYFCPVTFSLLLDPYQTRCCGNLLSRKAIQELEGKPCPVCREGNLSAIDDKFHKRKVKTLKVRCPHKSKGCEWEGELGDLESKHFNTSCYSSVLMGSFCQYLDVDCPYSCGETVQKHELEEHKSQCCPLRPFTCQYCNHKDTYQTVTEKHWPVCENYPLPCPNDCGKNKIQRQHLKQHLEKTCPISVVECEFSYAGCGTKLQRHLMPAHMKDKMEAHLSMMAQSSKQISELKEKVQQQALQIKKQEEEVKRLVKAIGRQKQQEKQEKLHMKTVFKLMADKSNNLVIPPVDVVMDEVEERKRNNIHWFSPPFYSHLGGYKMRLEVYGNGIGRGRGTHVSVFVCLMKGEFDDHLKWPFSGELTIELKGHSFNSRKTLHIGDDVMEEASSSADSAGHHTNIAAYHCASKPSQEVNTCGFGFHCFISHGELSQYVKNDSLSFCITEVDAY